VQRRALFDTADHFKMVDLVRTMPIPPPSRFRAEIPTAVDDIVFKALERPPAKRWQSAVSLRAALAAAAKEYARSRSHSSWRGSSGRSPRSFKVREDSGLRRSARSSARR